MALLHIEYIGIKIRIGFILFSNMIDIFYRLGLSLQSFVRFLAISIIPCKFTKFLLENNWNLVLSGFLNQFVNLYILFIEILLINPITFNFCSFHFNLLRIFIFIKIDAIKLWGREIWVLVTWIPSRNLRFGRLQASCVRLILITSRIGICSLECVLRIVIARWIKHSHLPCNAIRICRFLFFH